MAVKTFEDLIVWKKSQDFALSIDKTVTILKDYSYKNRTSRASVSISNHIAEGFDRRTKLDFTRFLCIAISSNSKGRSLVYL